jgi:hypothetical protein
MLDLARTRPFQSNDIPLSTTVTNIEAGACLVSITESGIEKVVTSAGTSSDKEFVGVAFTEPFRPTTMTNVELDYPTTAAPSVALQYAPVSLSTVEVLINGVAAGTIQSGSPGASTGVVQIVGSTLTLNSTDAATNPTLTVTYQYTLTVLQAQMLFGDGVPGAMAADVVGVIGVIQKGYVYVTNFDASQNWAAAQITTLKTGANGRFTVGGSGCTVPGRVVFTPTSDIPYLGLLLNA